MDELADVLPRLEAELGPLEGEPITLTEGITNRNARLRLGGADYVVRLCDTGAGVLGIDRPCEAEAGRRAAALGIGPEVVLAPPGEGLVVTRWLDGGTLSAEQVRAALPEIAAALRAIHATPPIGHAFAVFDLVSEHARIAGELPAAYPEIAALAARIEAALTGPEHAPRLCHNDLLTANFVSDGQRIQLVDWEYAGMNDPFFDLGNLSVNNGLSEDDDGALLEAYFGAPPDERRFAALRLMRVVSDLREAMWGAVQATISALDEDYEAYAAEHFARLEASASDPRVKGWIDAAAA